jgi:hypothetical protein
VGTFVQGRRAGCRGFASGNEEADRAAPLRVVTCESACRLEECGERKYLLRSGLRNGRGAHTNPVHLCWEVTRYGFPIGCKAMCLQHFTTMRHSCTASHSFSFPRDLWQYPAGKVVVTTVLADCRLPEALRDSRARDHDLQRPSRLWAQTQSGQSPSRITSPTMSSCLLCTPLNHPMKPVRPLPSSSLRIRDKPRFPPGRGWNGARCDHGTAIS